MRSEALQELVLRCQLLLASQALWAGSYPAASLPPKLEGTFPTFQPTKGRLLVALPGTKVSHCSSSSALAKPSDLGLEGYHLSPDPFFSMGQAFSAEPTILPSQPLPDFIDQKALCIAISFWLFLFSLERSNLKFKFHLLPGCGEAHL
jgi:hypothetical protein